MPILSIARAPCRAPARHWLLIAKAGTVWLWPGIPLTERRGGTIRPIPPDALRFWLSKLMGPEVVGQPVPMQVARAAEYLTVGDETAAQASLDRAPAGTLSPEGAMLARAVAARLGIDVPATPIAKRMPLWDRHFVLGLAPMFDRFAEAADWLDKAGVWDSDKHPRWPPGANEGRPGQFRPVDKPAVSVSSVPRPDPNRPGIGHNGGPPLFDDAPPVPPENPGASYRWPIIKALARWAAKRAVILAAEDAAGGPVGLALNAAQVAAWVYEYYPYIRAYNDPPKPLDELERAAQGPARRGYDVHHIVEQASGRSGEIPTQLINSGENLVSIPTLRHWQLNSWYQTPNSSLLDSSGNYMTPRKYLVGRGYDERRRVGLMGLHAVGVLK
ncbi:hypothetical protein GCM10011611_60360 [Aliidongia dinghuensis]|uniref:Uncharacterized protein n=1 Tax=Aliidongia dinghuensis TaxID=1867774 RepID=A0A8J2Z175_9PROT|nr:hypothetical protein [Aliidongia dinghuensis]GGF45847.1 hypothetical protein GCM10011611_60360 [Aliidongia dinghuensis]